MSSADGLNSTALGAASWAEMDDATAVGYGAYAGAGNSVALGAGSIADRVNSVSVGDVGGERQITNVAAGTEDTDAVNLAQLNEAADGALLAGKYFKATGGADSDAGAYADGEYEIGRATVCTPGTNAHHVCRHVQENKK